MTAKDPKLLLFHLKASANLPADVRKGRRDSTRDPPADTRPRSPATENFTCATCRRGGAALPPLAEVAEIVKSKGETGDWLPGAGFFAPLSPAKRIKCVGYRDASCPYVGEVCRSPHNTLRTY